MEEEEEEEMVRVREGLASRFGPLVSKTDTCLTAGLLLRGIKTAQVKSGK